MEQAEVYDVIFATPKTDEIATVRFATIAIAGVCAERVT